MGHVDGQAAGERHHARVEGRIRGGIGNAAERLDCRVVHDRPAPTVHHRGQYGVAHAQHMEQVQFVERLPLVLGAVQEVSGRGAEVADIVHQDVDPRILNGQRCFGHFGHNVAVADVAHDDRAPPARRSDVVVAGRGRVGIDIGKHHVGARRSKPSADAAADAQRTARDHGDLSRKPHPDSVLPVWQVG